MERACRCVLGEEGEEAVTPSPWARRVWEALHGCLSNEAGWVILDGERSRVLKMIRDVADQAHNREMTACDACDEILRRLGE